MARTLRNLFHDHPDAVGEGYSEHMVFAGRSGVRLIGAGAAALGHAVFPFLCERTASNLVITMHEEMVARRSGGVAQRQASGEPRTV